MFAVPARLAPDLLAAVRSPRTFHLEHSVLDEAAGQLVDLTAVARQVVAGKRLADPLAIEQLVDLHTEPPPATLVQGSPVPGASPTDVAASGAPMLERMVDPLSALPSEERVCPTTEKTFPWQRNAPQGNPFNSSTCRL